MIYVRKPEENDKHEYGVAFMINKNVNKSLIEWSAISERIKVARFKARFYNLYEQLQKTEDFFSNKYKRDIHIILGYLNAKIGNKNSGGEEVMGK